MRIEDVNQEALAFLSERLVQEYGPSDQPVLFVRCPGRTEIAGNHTDHEGGTVIAAAIDRYVMGLFRPNATRQVRIASEGYDPVTVDLDDLKIRREEEGTTLSIVRGMCAGFEANDVELAGFDAVILSEVPAGSGLSSSAAFELELGWAMNVLWANERLTRPELAIMARAVERAFFGKPCGLMDQAAVALGGIQHMSFRQDNKVDAHPLDFDFSKAGYSIVLVEVGASHEDLTSEHAAIPAEMQKVAQMFEGASRLGQICESDLAAHADQIRAECGDRALLRAIHYFREERLVEARAQALAAGDVMRFVELTRLSGVSSAMYLQNVSCGDPADQPAMVALAFADEIIGGGGACRIHGGGFGGTIQCFVPATRTERLMDDLDQILGHGESVCAAMEIDHEGASALWL